MSSTPAAVPAGGTTPSRTGTGRAGVEAEDPLRTVRAASRTAAPPAAAGGSGGGELDADDGREIGTTASPLSFKRRVPDRSYAAAAAAGTAAPASTQDADTSQSGKRSFSNLFNRKKPAGLGQIHLPPNPTFTPDASPSRGHGAGSRVSSMSRGGGGGGGGGRRVSTSNRGIHQTLAPSTPPTGLGKRIHDWQERAARSPLEAPSSPGVPGDNDGGDDDDDDAGNEDQEEQVLAPIVPNMLPDLKTPQYQTPLPKIATTVLCICMVGEFLSASVGSPFLLPMLEDLGVPGGGGEAAVGLWAGYVSAAFFLSQFATALLWASAATRYGRRTVLFVSLLGNTLMLLAYGTCKSVYLMVVIRLLQGCFNGAVGVARGAVKDITDSTNEGQAYSVLGVCWSLGGILGPVIGGWLEHPVEHIPSLFGNSELFHTYPYLLPTGVAACVTATGCILSTFLSYDGGPRDGSIRLPEEKDVERAVSTVAAIPGTVRKRLSGYFSGPSPDASHISIGSDGDQVIASPGPMSDTRGSTLAPAPAQQLAHKKSRTSFAVPHRGSAYGYDHNSRRRETAASRFRRLSAATSTRYAPDYEGEEPELPPLNFAQKLLFANGEAGTFNITDVWIAAATRDEGDPYTAAGLDEDPFAEDGESALLEEDQATNLGDDDDDEEELDMSLHRDPFASEGGANMSAAGTGGGPLSRLRHDSMATGTTSVMRRGSPMRHGGGGPTAGHSGRVRSGSIMSTSIRPAIYQNTGLVRSPITSPAIRRDSVNTQYFDQAPNALNVPGTSGTGGGAAVPAGQQQPLSLAAIPEGKAPSADLLTVPGQSDAATVREASPGPSVLDREKEALQNFSVMRDLPITLIGQYTLLALHGTIMDQVFMSYLLSKSYAGGLGLESSDYADIIACMCIFQMLFQFRFYPTVSLPLGRLTHLQMFRLGLFLYLIPYTFFPELRPLLGGGGEQNRIVTFGLILLTATRYLANTCAYTAVMIMVNAMTPPAYIPFANGLAQSAVSLARFVGPLTGGILWSSSIKDGPDGYWLGFAVCACICGLGLLHSFTIR